MKNLKLTFLILALNLFFSCTHEQNQNDSQMIEGDFSTYPVYEGKDLEMTYTKEATTFRIWAPTAKAAVLRLYDEGIGGKPIAEHKMKKDKKGTWLLKLDGDLKGKFYTFQVEVGDRWMDQNPGVYAKAVGVNGLRACVVDLAETNPQGWEADKRPPLANFNDIILYELQVRDLTISPTSGAKNKGKFLGLAETGTTNSAGYATGIDHIAELGITHVHLLPVFDYLRVDETKLDTPQYNWGYDPLNYNALEGSFATDPYNPAVRIKEFKELVMAFHNKGIRVVMDVVYNHTSQSFKSYFNQLVPDYYYRHDAEGEFSNSSGCGNETASEREMMRRYMIESLIYYATEYHIDGFRFDLMGIHDIQTMNMIRAEMDKIDPTIFLYGEGWTAGACPLPDSLRALKANTMQLNGIAAFSDDIRDAIKGHWSDEKERGYVSGKPGLEESVKFGIIASTPHKDIRFSMVNYSDTAWAKEPSQTINYVSCHDNHTLWDKLSVTNPEDSEADRIKMHKLANAIVLTSQGVPFLHAGVEILRTKQGVHNSFESPDSINQINWDWKTKYIDVFNYYKALIALRKAHPAFRMTSTEMLNTHLHFSHDESTGIVAYSINGNANGDKWKDILVVFNANRTATHVTLPPESTWTIVLNGEKYLETGIETITNGNLMAAPLSATILVDTKSVK